MTAERSSSWAPATTWEALWRVSTRPPAPGLSQQEVDHHLLVCPQTSVAEVQWCRRRWRSRERERRCWRCCSLGFYRPQNKVLPSARRRSGCVSASQTALTAPFNLTTVCLLDCFPPDLCPSTHFSLFGHRVQCCSWFCRADPGHISSSVKNQSSSYTVVHVCVYFWCFTWCLAWNFLLIIKCILYYSNYFALKVSNNIYEVST